MLLRRAECRRRVLLMTHWQFAANLRWFDVCAGLIEIEGWVGGWLDVVRCLVEQAQIHGWRLIEAIRFAPQPNPTALGREQRESAERKIASFAEELTNEKQTQQKRWFEITVANL